jgi:hypothetical protein
MIFCRIVLDKYHVTSYLLTIEQTTGVTDMKFATFTVWHNQLPDYTGPTKSVTVNPLEVSDIEDHCGTIRPGSVITLKNKKTYLVAGIHADIVAALEAAKESA